MTEQREMKTALVFWMNRTRTAAFELGLYAAAALVMPGGIFVAALVWLYRHRKPAAVQA
jgi:hypothetical protein